MPEFPPEVAANEPAEASASGGSKVESQGVSWQECVYLAISDESCLVGFRQSDGIPFLQPSNSVPRRVASDVTIEQYAFIRVHCHPKRFPAAHDYNWKVTELTIAAVRCWRLLNLTVESWHPATRASSSCLLEHRVTLNQSTTTQSQVFSFQRLSPSGIYVCQPVV